MSYIGNQPFTAAFLTDTFSGNGSTVAFTMTVAPANTSSIIVAITGVLQDPSTYSVSGTTLTFSAAPPSGTSNISVRYLGIPASGVTTTAYRTVTNTTATAGQTSFTIPSYTVGYVDVYRNGVYLPTSDYTATTGTTVVLTNAATVGDTITTISFYVSSVLNAIPATAASISLTSATYLSGILPVAYGGTGLTTVPHTVQVFTSGSGTYTLPTNCKAIWVRCVGGGAGGGAGNNGTGSTAGGATTFGTSLLTANGGGAAAYTSMGSGGTATGGDINITGGGGAGGTFALSGTNSGFGGTGGNSFYGAGGSGSYGTGGTASFGGGGGGGGCTAISSYSGCGGGAGGYAEKLINSPSATYSYAVGAGGAGTAAGASASAGGTGGSGLIIVMEFYV